jgi:hypothetical protein
MRKVFLVAAAVLAIGIANAQTGKNQFGVGAELGIGTASGSKVSYGASVKYLHGVGSAGQTTFSLGWLHSSTSEEIGGVKYKTSSSLIPLLVGYRHNFGQIYAEPQAGLSLNTYKSTVGNESSSDSKLALGYAIGGGYITDGGFDLGIRFFNTTQSGAKGMFVFRVGYNFGLGGGSASK